MGSHQAPSAVNIGGRYIFTFREPNATTVSVMRFQQNKGRLPPDHSLLDYVKSDHHYLGKYFGFNVCEFYMQFYKLREFSDRVLFVSFEKLKSNPTNEVRRIAAFMNIEVTDERVAEIVQLTSRDSMLEHVTKFDDHWMAQAQKEHGTCNKIMEPAAKVTSGHSVTWCEESLKVMQEMWLRTFGETGLNSYEELIANLEADGYI